MSSVLDGENRAASGTALLVEPVSGGWRLCDAAVPAGDAAHVIGYVEPIGEAFDVVWCTGPRRRQPFARWSDVVTAAERHLVRMESRGPTAPVRIPHLPPPR